MTEFCTECQHEVPVPLITFHGTADKITPFDGIPERVARWADRNGCEPEPKEDAVSDEVTRITYD